MKLKGEIVAYSPSELEVLDLLSRKTKKTTMQIVEARYGKKVPYHGKSNVTSVLRSLAAKIEANAEDVVLMRTPKHQGPVPVQYWLESRS